MANICHVLHGLHSSHLELGMVIHTYKHPSIRKAEILGWVVPSSLPPVSELELEIEAHIKFARQGNLNWKETMAQTHLQD